MKSYLWMLALAVVLFGSTMAEACSHRPPAPPPPVENDFGA